MVKMLLYNVSAQSGPAPDSKCTLVSLKKWAQKHHASGPNNKLESYKKIKFSMFPYL